MQIKNPFPEKIRLFLGFLGHVAFGNEYLKFAFSESGVDRKLGIDGFLFGCVVFGAYEDCVAKTVYGPFGGLYVETDGRIARLEKSCGRRIFGRKAVDGRFYLQTGGLVLRDNSQGTSRLPFGMMDGGLRNFHDLVGNHFERLVLYGFSAGGRQLTDSASVNFIVGEIHHGGMSVGGGEPQLSGRDSLP